MTDRQLLRRAWDALDSFKQAYPENWSEEDEQVLKDLMRADLNLSGVKLKWQGLTDEAIWLEYQTLWPFHPAEERRLAADIAKFARAIEAKLKEKNKILEEK